MTEQTYNRKLVAILSADVKGYSRLMGEDEEATVQILNEYRRVIADLIEKHHGRLVDSPGDNLLAEFASVVNALRCAWDIQQETKARNMDLPQNRQMNFRIGVNLGDVIEEDRRIYGDGVNIAARLEGLAEAGGICISGTAYDQIKNKLPFEYENHGEQSVKNIKEPVRVYRVIMAPGSHGDPAGEKRTKSGHRQWMVLAAAILILGATVAAFWYLYWRKTPPSRITPLVYDRPTIAVLPFANLSEDPQQEYFCDGITNDIITDLSKFRNLFVIASNTVFTYKGKPVKVTEVGKALSVQYTLEGSVQEAGERVRINAQLSDAVNGNQLWAQRYDRKKKDLFTLQDEIIQIIVRTLAVKIETTEQTRVMRKDTTNYQAYDYYIRGSGYLLQSTQSANSKARQLLEKAIELDPHFASAYTALGWYYHEQVEFGWTEFIEQVSERALSLARKALSIDDSQASAHKLIGSIYSRNGQYELAEAELRKALDLNPNDARLHGEMGEVMLYSGQTDDAIKFLNMRLRYDPNTVGTYMELGLAYYLKGRYDDSVKILQQGLARNPDFAGHHIVIAAAYAQLGRIDDAQHSAQEFLRRNPFFEVESYGTVFRTPADRNKIIEGLRKAGLK